MAETPEKPDWWDELVALIAADPDWHAKYTTTEAARGNPYPLIGRLLKRRTLSDAEIRLIITALEHKAGKETATDLRIIEQKLIAARVDGMIDEDKLTQKQAIDVVCKERDCSVRTHQGCHQCLWQTAQLHKLNSSTSSKSAKSELFLHFFDSAISMIKLTGTVTLLERQCSKCHSMNCLPTLLI